MLPIAWLSKVDRGRQRRLPDNPHQLHSWNFPRLYHYRPAWDILVMLLLAGGSVLCITGVVIGWSFQRRPLTFQ
jgi:hypothetical protein